MPAPALDIDREAIKTLCLAVGITEACKRTGVSHQAIRKRSSREGWFKPKPLPPSMQPIPVTNVTKPSDALASTLQQRKNSTRLHLSKYAMEAAEIAAESGGNHKLSRSTKDVADIMTKLWPEQSSGSGGLNLQLLTGQVAIQYNTGPASQD